MTDRTPKNSRLVIGISRQRSLQNLETESVDELVLKVHIPQLVCYNFKRFPANCTVKQAIDNIVKGIPALQNNRYHLYSNGLRLMDEDRSLKSYGVKEGLELKRGLEYELKLKSDPRKPPLYLEGEGLKTSEATKMIAAWVFPDHVSGTYQYQLLKKSSLRESQGESITLEESKLFFSFQLRVNDELILKGSSSRRSTQSVDIIISYSPVSLTEQAKLVHMKQGHLSKLGGGAGGSRSWKKRYFVLSEEKLEYYKDLKTYQTRATPLGVVFLEDFVEVSTITFEDEKISVKDKTKKKAFPFALRTIARRLVMYADNRFERDDWVDKVKAIGELARATYASLPNEIREKKERSRKEYQTKDYGKSIGDNLESDVGTPFNVVHKSHVNKEFKWTGNSMDPQELFEVQQKLGQGACGSVLKAKHRESGFELAIKVVKQSNKMVQQSIEKEIEVLKKCRSPLVVAYYGTALRDDSIWILMDYCAVGSVKDVMNDCMETLTEQQCAYVVQNTLKGLEYLHTTMKIFHLDVKSANILLTESGMVKLADFGVSEQLQSNTKFIAADDFVGSPLFMAPEVILKQGYNSKADIWSLGVTVIEMADGRPPNTDIKSIEQLPIILERPPPTFKNPRKWSNSFNEFLSSCLVKDPQDRPSAFDLLMHPFMMSIPGPEVLSGIILMALRLKSSRGIF